MGQLGSYLNMKIDNNNFKRLTIFTLILVGISVVVAHLFFVLLEEIFDQLPEVIQIAFSIPSVPSIYISLFYIFDRWAWRFPIFKFLGIIASDNLNGRWQGVIRTSWRNPQGQDPGDIPAELLIKQNATSIKIYGKFNQSRSVSIHEHFGENVMLNQMALYYFYKNDPNYNAVPTMATHEGSAMLIYDKNQYTLSGYYYSGRDRNNYGTIIVKRV